MGKKRTAKCVESCSAGGKVLALKKKEATNPEAIKDAQKGKKAKKGDGGGVEETRSQ